MKGKVTRQCEHPVEMPNCSMRGKGDTCPLEPRIGCRPSSLEAKRQAVILKREANHE